MIDENQHQSVNALSENLLQGLMQHGFERERADAVVHALVDIDDSMRKIYDKLLPELMRSLDQSEDVFKERLWDVREEFRHVEYHLRDAGLVDL